MLPTILLCILLSVIAVALIIATIILRTISQNLSKLLNSIGRPIEGPIGSAGQTIEIINHKVPPPPKFTLAKSMFGLLQQITAILYSNFGNHEVAEELKNGGVN